VSVRLSLRTEQLDSHWTGFHEIIYVNTERKSANKIQVSLKSDKNNGYCRARQATDENRAHEHCMLDTYGHRHLLNMCNTYCFSTTTMVTQTRLNVTSDVRYLSCFFSCDLCESENVRRAHRFRRGLSFTFTIISTVHIIREYSQYSLNAVTFFFCFSRGMTVTFRLSYVCPASPVLTSSYIYIENVHVHSCTTLLHGEILCLLYLIR
jgi:hypothetical protein